MIKRTPLKQRAPAFTAPKVVGLAGNAFGTRLCQRVLCSRCHQVDYVAIRIANAKTIYCRSCAERLLETFETGRHIARKKLKRSCMKCKNQFLVSESIADKKDELMCQDCFRGFEVWRGKASDTDKESRYVIKKNSAKTIIRKLAHDTI